jgi:hypothetical protein
MAIGPKSKAIGPKDIAIRLKEGMLRAVPTYIPAIRRLM